MTTNSPHVPVLLHECLNALIPDSGHPPSRIIDGTLGAGGHTIALLQQGVKEILGLDVDATAVKIASTRLSDFEDRVHIRHASYVTMAAEAHGLGWDKVDGILLDLGASSMQFDTPDRGFSFQYDATLDMRFDQSDSQLPASVVVNSWSENDLIDIFRTYGEENHARRYAQAIISNRPIETTQQLASIIEEATPRPARKSNARKIHPATRIFQALRIQVNDELQSIEKVIPAAIDLLRPGGRLAMISFHSLEDRIVKRLFRDASTAIEAPPGMASIQEKSASVQLVTRKPIVASTAEIADNPRSRSAKLRVVEKL